jgi:hypothetical protein
MRTVETLKMTSLSCQAHANDAVRNIAFCIFSVTQHALPTSGPVVTKAPCVGGPGPRLESWAFVIDGKGLQTLLARGVFATRACKLCEDGVVVMGEYGITVALFEKGYSIDTLMAKYGSVDWQDPINWKCNDQVSPNC